ncbi:hypothetical protein [Shewanella subflava]|uniref:Uncharacterized protein n=1 Tax=Shewanella subflava TaxID=2986476 RepID=A0ABT3I5S1_9GAMM|nr:hypothetical protein [Shewanella subflava]MCW3171392.1 hypothetical protein [Shewanella subflava]
MKTNATFKHLLMYYRNNKCLLCIHAKSGDNIQIAQYLGALDCLYWQALGNGLTNLAKGIRRTITHSYRFHQVRLPCHPFEIIATIETRPDNAHPGEQIDIEDLIRGAA